MSSPAVARAAFPRSPSLRFAGARGLSPSLADVRSPPHRGGPAVRIGRPRPPSSTMRFGSSGDGTPAAWRLWLWPSGSSPAPDITRLLDKLEQKKLIRRERLAANRRVVEVRLTEGGLKLLQMLDEPVRRCHARQLGHLPAARLRQLIALLNDVRQPHEPAGGPWAEKP